MVHGIADSILQIGVETSPGSGGFPNKVAPNLMLTMGQDGDPGEVYMGSNEKYPNDVSTGREWGTSTFDMPLCFDESWLVFGSCLNYAAPTGAGAAKTWSGKPRLSGADPYKTYVVEQGPPTAPERFRYLHFNGFTWKVSETTSRLSGPVRSKAGLPMTAIVTEVLSAPVTAGGSGYTATPTAVFSAAPAGYLTATGTVTVVANVVTAILITNPGSYPEGTVPTIAISGGAGAGATAVAVMGVGSYYSSPVPKINWSLFWADSWAGLASESNRILDGFDFEFTQGDKFGPYFPINALETSFAGIAGLKPPVSLGLTLGYGVTGSDYSGPATLVKKRAGTLIFWRCKATGGEIVSGTNESLYIDVCTKILNMPSRQDVQNVILGQRWTLQPVIDPTSREIYRIGGVNRTGALI